MPESPASIAMFVPDLRPGGAERVLLNLARGFLQRGVRVDLILLRKRGAFVSDVPSGARIVELRAGRARSSPRALARYLRQERPDALLTAHDHASLAALCAQLLARGTTRTIVTFHTTVSAKHREAAGFARRLTTALLKRFAKRADAIVAVSGDSARDLAAFLGIDASRIRVIANPVIASDVKLRGSAPVDHPWIGDPSAPTIVAAGRLSVEKDFATLVRAVTRLRDTTRARLLILGDGPERGRLQALIDELGVGERVQLIGFVDNPYAYIAKADVFVLCSVREALPMVIAEALVLGAQIVATDCPTGPREMLRDGALGRLVPMGDPPALAAAIEGALEAPIEYDATSASRPFDFETAISKYLEVAGVDPRGT